MKSFHEI